MILYTPLAIEDIFSEDESEYENHKWVNIGDKVMKVQDLKDGTFEIMQVISTNPNDYLNVDYSPGMRIRM
jgi:hypothetical protein